MVWLTVLVASTLWFSFYDVSEVGLQHQWRLEVIGLQVVYIKTTPRYEELLAVARGPDPETRNECICAQEGISKIEL